MNVPMKSLSRQFAVRSIKQVLWNLFLITVGSILCAIAINGILIPNKFLSAGLMGLVLIKFFPLHYFLDVGLGILLKGAGLNFLWKPILGIAVLGSVIFSFGMWRFRRQFD